MTQFYAGQAVLLIESGGRGTYEHKVRIDKVGRKYATVTLYHRQYQFDLETGQPAKPDQRNRIVTEERRAIELENNRKDKFLRGYGIHKFELHGIKDEDFYGLYGYLTERGYK
jgi:hypothetical protein